MNIPRRRAGERGSGLIPGSGTVGKAMFNWSEVLFEALNNFLTLLFFYVFVRRISGWLVCFLRMAARITRSIRNTVNVADLR
jgi:hypothetical protein